MHFKGRLMSVFESILLAFNKRAAMIQFFILIIICRVDRIGCGPHVDQITRSYHGLNWIGSIRCWIGLDWILQNGPMCNSRTN